MCWGGCWVPSLLMYLHVLMGTYSSENPCAYFTHRSLWEITTNTTLIWVLYFAVDCYFCSQTEEKLFVSTTSANEDQIGANSLLKIIWICLLIPPSCSAQTSSMTSAIRRISPSGMPSNLHVSSISIKFCLVSSSKLVTFSRRPIPSNWHKYSHHTAHKRDPGLSETSTTGCYHTVS